MSITAQRTRLEIFADDFGVPSLDRITGGTPLIPVGNAWRVEVGIFSGSRKDSTPVDLSSISWLKLEVFGLATGNAPDSTLHITSGEVSSFDTTLAIADWKDGSDQHVVFTFEDQDTNLDISTDATRDFFLVVSGETTGGEAITFGWTKLTLKADGTPAATSGPVQPGNLVPGSTNYDGSGNYTLTGLTSGDVYEWIDGGANDTSCVNGADTHTASGTIFTAAGTSVTLKGTASAAITAIVRADPFISAGKADARYMPKSVLPWDNATQYYTDDVVTNQGGIWQAKQDNLNQAPPTLPTAEDSHWRALVEPGDDGAAGSNGTNGTNGTNGANAYVYQAWASDASGTGFTNTFDSALKYTAFKTSSTALSPPVVGDFTGLWVKYVGDDGADGADGAGDGDMKLADAQTVTGSKSFADSALRVFNAAQTFYAALKFAGTSNRDITLPAFASTLERAPEVYPLVYGASVALDFQIQQRWRSLSLTGNVILTTANRVAGEWLTLRVLGDTSERLFSTTEAWTVMGDPLPAAIPANKELILHLRAFGTSAADVLAVWELEGSPLSHEAITIEDADTTEIKPEPGNRFHNVLATVTEEIYSAAYTHEVVLKTQNATAGDQIALYFDMPASTDPTIRVWNNTATGSALLEFTGLEAGHDLWALFEFDGTAWNYKVHKYATDAVVSNEFLTGSETYAATVNLNLDGPSRQTLSLTGAVTLNTTNRPDVAGKGKSIAVELTASGADRAVTVNANWLWLTEEPGTIASGDAGILVIEAWGTAETDVRAAWAPYN